MSRRRRLRCRICALHAAPPPKYLRAHSHTPLRFRRCKKTTALSKLMNAFCQRQGVNLNAVRFLFDGTRINSDQTPEGLEMEDGDVIDVMVEQQGGGRRGRQ